MSVKGSGKERLVLDLRHVNKFVDKQKVKFQGVKEAMVYTNYSKYAIQFDLKSNYHDLEIHPEHQNLSDNDQTFTYVNFFVEMHGMKISL